MATAQTVTLLTLVLAGCTAPSDDSSDLGDQTGDPAAVACTGTETYLTLDETSPLGFSGQDLLENVAATHTVTLNWTDGTSSSLELDLEHDSTFQDNGQVIYFENETDHSSCYSELYVPVQLSLVTSDGLLNELAIDYLLATEATEGVFYFIDSADYMGGSIDLSDWTDKYDAATTQVIYEASFAPAGSTGDVRVWTQDGETTDVASW
jgi:hypothetical protein